MAIIQAGGTAGNAIRVESVISERVIAAIAAHAATSVAGVTRLEPGVTGLVSSIARTARQRFKGLNPVPAEGVRVIVERKLGATPTILRVEIDLALSGQDQAAAVAQNVQRSVARAVVEATGLVTSTVSVSIMDIGLPGGAR